MSKRTYLAAAFLALPALGIWLYWRFLDRWAERKLGPVDDDPTWDPADDVQPWDVADRGVAA